MKNIFGACVLAAAGLAVIFLPFSRRPGMMEPLPAKPALPAALPEARTQPVNATLASDFARARHQAQADILARFREKLRQWQLESDPAARSGLMDELLALMTADNADELVQSLSPDELDAAAGNAVLERWLTVDPDAAADWLAARFSNNGPSATLVAREFLKTPDGFKAYCDRLPDGEWKQAVLGAAGAEMASQNPAEAVALAQQMKPGNAQAGLLQSAAFAWGRQDPTAAMAQLEQVADPDLREAMMASAAKGCAETDPARAADWLVASVKSEGLLNEAAVYIVRSWAANEPQAAADWVSRFPAGPVRDQALENLICQWTSSDYSAAAAWVMQLPDGPLRPQAGTILARQAPPAN